MDLDTSGYLAVVVEVVAAHLLNFSGGRSPFWAQIYIFSETAYFFGDRSSPDSSQKRF